MNGRNVTMKELYTKPIVEIEKFSSVDVVTTSPVTDGIGNFDGEDD